MIVNDKELYPLAELFKAFSDPTRLKILSALMEKEYCVSDLAKELNMTDSAVSHQLKTLRHSRLVKGVREGKLIYYSLDDDHVLTMLNQGLSHINH